jgi:aspartate/methionine/tyrosine aminotransferase
MISRAWAHRPVGDVLAPVEDALDLRSFDPDFLKDHFPLEHLAAAFDPARWFGYAAVEGDADLREALADRLSIGPDHILITDGASQALYLSMLAGLDAGDTVFSPWPVFPAYTRMAAYRGCVSQTYPCAEEPDALIARLEATAPGAAKGLVINSPHNPTGRSWPVRHVAEVLDAAARCGALTILDDTYHWIDGGTGAITKLATLAADGRAAERTVAVASLGKYLCLPGLRLGFAVSRNAGLIARMTEAKRHLSHASCGAAQRLALSLLGAKGWLQGRGRLLDELRRRRDQLESKLGRLGVRAVSPACGFYVYATQVGALTRRGILGIGGPVFDAGADEARYCLAVGAQTWRCVLESLDQPETTHGRSG